MAHASINDVPMMASYRDPETPSRTTGATKISN
jgi:hypothetical protein